MKTKVHICLCCLFLCVCVCATARKFDDLDARTKHYIVDELFQAARDSDIAILHNRVDEAYRMKDSSLNPYHRIPLNLCKSRFMAMLKGLADIAHNEVLYIYVPEKDAIGRPFVWREIQSKKWEETRPPPYRPSFSQDDLMRLVFMQRQMIPLKSRILAGYRNRYGNRMTEFIDDALAMDAEELMGKYDLKDVFASRVYQLMEGCIFQVDYPMPEMPETEDMSMNRKNWELTKAHTPEVQKYSRLIHLTKREISEIVLIAYMLVGDDGIAQYAVASKDSPILEPITRPVFKTGIGKGMFEALEKVEKLIGNASQQTTNQTAIGIPQIPGSGKTNDLGTAGNAVQP